MGLDVYLSHCVDRVAARAAEAAAEAASEAIWAGHDYDKLTDSEKDRLHEKSKQARHQYGCDDWGSHNTVQDIQLPSEQYPEHLFRIGYFRSSYNDGGINRVLRNLGLGDLYQIMGVEQDQYEVHHDWAQCRDSVIDTIQRYEAHLNSPAGKFWIMSQRRPFTDGVSSAQEALEIFSRELESNPNTDEDMSSYSTAQGEFHLRGVRVFGIVPSSDRFVQAYLFCERETPAQEDFYLQALRIMQETCEYVLRQDDPQNYYMRWSG